MKLYNNILYLTNAEHNLMQNITNFEASRRSVAFLLSPFSSVNVVLLPITTIPPFNVSRAGKHLRVTETQGKVIILRQFTDALLISC